MICTSQDTIQHNGDKTFSLVADPFNNNDMIWLALSSKQAPLQQSEYVTDIASAQSRAPAFLSLKAFIMVASRAE